MAHAIDPRVARFLRAHSVSLRAEVEADVADDRDLTPSERWRLLVGLCRSIPWVINSANPPEVVARILEDREPPHPSYRELVARLRLGPRSDRRRTDRRGGAPRLPASRACGDDQMS